MEMKLVDYEIMCKYVAVKDFCNCETEAIQVVDQAASQQVLDEFYITRSNSYDEEGQDSIIDLDLQKESSITAFVAGVIVTVLVISIVSLVIFLMYRVRSRSQTKIVLRELNRS